MDSKTLKHILNVLRQGTTRWHLRSAALRRCRKRVLEDSNGKQKWKLYWQCEKCKCWKRQSSELEVDHIVEVGKFNGDFNAYIKRLYCELTNLQSLCIDCHLKKTLKFNATTLYERKKEK